MVSGSFICGMIIAHVFQQVYRAEIIYYMPCRILVINFYPVVNGISSFVMGAYRHMDRSRFQFDFLISEEYRTYTFFLDEIRNLGGRIFYFDYNRENFHGERIEKLREFLLEHPEMRGVHVHDTRWQTGPLLLADELGLPIKVIHSHASCGRTGNQKYLSDPAIMERIQSISDSRYVRLACSDLAAQYAFNDLPYVMLPNGVDTEKFVYKSLYRELARKTLGISPGTCVIGFVANNSLNKNVPKAVAVFEEFKRIVPDSIMLMIGYGYSRGEAFRSLSTSPCKDSIRVIKAPGMVDMLHPALDIVLSTSVNEGLPFAIVEAQATGLPCLISDEITSMVCITDLVKLFSLEKNAREWAEELHRMLEESGSRVSRTEEIRAAGFDIRQVASKLMDIYQSQLDGHTSP